MCYRIAACNLCYCGSAYMPKYTHVQQSHWRMFRPLLTMEGNLRSSTAWTVWELWCLVLPSAYRYTPLPILSKPLQSSSV